MPLKIRQQEIAVCIYSILSEANVNVEICILMEFELVGFEWRGAELSYKYYSDERQKGCLGQCSDRLYTKTGVIMWG